MYKYEVAVALLYLEFGLDSFCSKEAEEALAKCPVYIGSSTIAAARRKKLLKHILKTEAKEEREKQGRYYHPSMNIRRISEEGRVKALSIIEDKAILTKYFLKYTPRFDRAGNRKY